MKKDIHPSNYRPVLFVDSSSGAEFILPSTVKTKDTLASKKDKKEYPVYYVEISSTSHPFYTGQDKTIDTAGRVERFRDKQAKASSKTKSKK